MGRLMQLHELGKRVAVSVVGIPVFLGLILIGKIPFLILVNAILVMSLWEFYGLAEKKGFFPSKLLGIISVLIMSWDLYFNQGRWLGGILLFVIFFIFIVELFKGMAHAMANSAITLLGLLYISLFSSFLMIRELPLRIGMPYRFGGWMVLFIFVTIWICDTAAYLLGSRFGIHPLFRRVSPKKTWEGAVGGFVIGIGAAIGLRYLFLPSLSILNTIGIGIIVCIVGQISDLVESLYKRDSGLKDSSNIIPGHGGILDRFDSPLLVGPAVYLYLILRVFST